MNCPKCESDNLEGIKFCEECGAKLEFECPDCKAKIPLGKKFCGEGGHDLTKTFKAPVTNYSEPQSYTPKFLADKILTTRSAIEVERKLVTVLFAVRNKLHVSSVYLRFFGASKSCGISNVSAVLGFSKT